MIIMIIMNSINSMNIMDSINMSTMMAEDTGAAELRNPLNSGMRKHTKGILRWFFDRRK